MKRPFFKGQDKKRWGYVSVMLIGILALGYATPYALAQTTSDVPQMFQQLLNLAGSIKTDTGNIKAKTDNLPTDPASTTDVREAESA
ncbi:MAG: hypothetical protein ACJ71B_13060, partial [Nitrososphaera sp.]